MLLRPVIWNATDDKRHSNQEIITSVCVCICLICTQLKELKN